MKIARMQMMNLVGGSGVPTAIVGGAAVNVLRVEMDINSSAGLFGTRSKYPHKRTAQLWRRDELLLLSRRHPHSWHSAIVLQSHIRSAEDSTTCAFQPGQPR